MEIQSIENELASLKQQGEIFHDNIKTVSNTIKQLEDILIKLNINIPFECQASEDLLFIWDTNTKRNGFRLLVQYKEAGTDGEIVMHNKPIDELPLRVRLAIFKHLPYFINDFTTFLDEYNQKIQIVIKEAQL